MKLLILAVVVAAASALSDCDPIDPARCALPFPNNFWLRPNATTGKLQLQFGKYTFPRDASNRTTDAAVGGWNDADGFSASMPITSFWTNLSLDSSKVPRYWAMDGSTQKDTPTILLDTQSGMLVPHFCELDFWAANGQGQQMFIMWPAFRLADSRRYIVAMRNLVKTDGTAQQPSVAFKALRDNIPTTNPDVEERRGLFKDIFARLSALGVDQSSLLIAWDFTTASRDALTGRMIAMRDDAFARVAPEDIKYSIKTVTDNVSADIIREIKGSFWVPSYVNSPYPGSRLVLDVNGRPVYQRMDEATFTVRVPYSLVGNGTTGIILQYGHGLFGSQAEVHGGYLGQEANQHGYVLAAADWIGLSQYDEPSVAIMMATDLTNFNIIPDRCQQGMLNALFLMRLLGNGVFSRDPAMMWNGKPVLDKSSPKHYFGNSQGGILGTMYMAVTTEVTRGCVGVPGGPYSLMLPRSKDFAPLATILKARYVDPLDRFIWFGVFQLLWDRADPGAYMGAITSNPLPNTPAHELLIHHALGDQQVTYLGAYNIGRSVGAVMFESNVHEPNETLYGFPFVRDTDVAHTAAIVTWVFPDVPPVPQIDIPPPGDKDTHEGPRREKTAQDQMYHFFTTGEIINTCGGPCRGGPQRTTREVDPWAKLENPAKLLA